jgi:beta-lactamase regulating signal transducer with metallopeptidase domain
MIDILLRSSIILLLTIALSKICRRITASLRHLMWLTGLVAAALLPVAAATLPEFDLPVLPPSPVVAAPPATLNIIQARLTPATPKPAPWPDTVRLWFKTHWLVPLWAIGVVCVLFRFLLAVTTVQRLLRNSPTRCANRNGRSYCRTCAHACQLPARYSC